MKHTAITAALAAALFTAPTYADMDAGVRALEARDFEAAIGHFEESLDKPDTAFDAHWRLGEALVKAGEEKDALDYLEKAVEMQPDHVQAQYWWGAANGQRAGKASIFSAPGYAKKCRVAFERVLELDPTHVDAREGLIQFHVEAPGIVGGDKDRARELATEMMEIDRYKGLSFTAMIQQGTDDRAGALETYAAMIAEFPTELRPYLDRGLTLRELERYDAAAADLKTLASATPTPTGNKDTDNENTVLVSLGRYFLGSVASRSGEHLADGAAALEGYLKDAKFDHPAREGYARYYLADIYLKAGEVEKARHYVTLAEKAEKDKDLKKLIKTLKKAIKDA